MRGRNVQEKVMGKETEAQDVDEKASTCLPVSHCLGFVVKTAGKAKLFKNFLSVRESKHYFILAMMLLWPGCATETISPTHCLGCAEKIIPSCINITRFCTYLYSQSP